jgi:hypothetical protein
MGAGHGGLIGTMNSRSSNAGLRLGDVFEVSSSQLLSALMHGGQDASAFGYGAMSHGSVFHVDDHDNITEFTASEVDVVRKEAERDLPHCNGFRRDGTPARCARCCPTDDWRADGILTRASIR